MSQHNIESVPPISSWLRLKLRIANLRSMVIDIFLILAMNVLKKAYANQPIPFWLYAALQRVARFGDRAIAYVIARFDISSAVLRDEKLASLMHAHEMVGWSLDAATLNYLEQEIKSHKPSVIVEFGSGISTVILTSYMLSLHQNSNRIYVISIEQDAEYATHTREKLSDAGLEQNAVVLVAPLVEHHLEGQPYWCYDLNKQTLAGYLTDRRVDMLVIDGPSGGGLNRFGTLEMLFESLSAGAMFYMDDAYRQYETRVGQLWARHLSVRICGVVPAGKGILVGHKQTIGNKQ
ncbi:MAG TPA: hypothetical protein VHP83_21115 [Aggregatilineaceae bacterium]|nr:hypothetical protein [Aggregatilineaceae bacterium]